MNSNKKKRATACLSLCLAILLTGCGGGDTPSEVPAVTPATTTTSATTVTTKVDDLFTQGGVQNTTQFEAPTNQAKFENLISRLKTNLAANGIAVVDAPTNLLNELMTSMPTVDSIATSEAREFELTVELQNYFAALQGNAAQDILSLNPKQLKAIQNVLANVAVETIKVEAPSEAVEETAEAATESTEVTDTTEATVEDTTTEVSKVVLSSIDDLKSYISAEFGDTDAAYLNNYVQLLYDTVYRTTYIDAYDAKKAADAAAAEAAKQEAEKQEAENAANAEQESSEAVNSEGSTAANGVTDTNTPAAGTGGIPGGTGGIHGGTGGIPSTGNVPSAGTTVTAPTTSDATIVDTKTVTLDTLTSVLDELGKICDNAAKRADTYKEGTTALTYANRAFSLPKIAANINKEVNKNSARMEQWHTGVFNYMITQAQADETNYNRWMMTLENYISSNISKPGEEGTDDYSKWQSKLVSAYTTLPQYWVAPNDLIYYNTLGMSRSEYESTHGITTLFTFPYVEPIDLLNQLDEKYEIPEDKRATYTNKDLGNMIKSNLTMADLTTNISMCYPVTTAFLTPTETVSDFSSTFAATADNWGVPAGQTSMEMFFYAGSGNANTIGGVDYDKNDFESTPEYDFYYQTTAASITQGSSNSLGIEKSEDLMLVNQALNNLWHWVDADDAPELYAQLQKQKYPDYILEQIVAESDNKELSLPSARIQYNEEKEAGKRYRVCVIGGEDEEATEGTVTGGEVPAEKEEPVYITFTDKNSFAEVAELLFIAYYDVQNGLPTKHLEDFGVEVPSIQEEQAEVETGTVIGGSPVGGSPVGGSPVGGASADENTGAEGVSSTDTTTMASGVTNADGTPVEPEVVEEEEEEQFRVFDTTAFVTLTLDENGDTGFYKFFKEAFPKVVNEIDDTGALWTQICKYIEFETLNYRGLGELCASCVNTEQSQYGVIFGSGSKACFTQMNNIADYDWRLSFMLGSGEVTDEQLRAAVLDYVLMIGQLTGEDYERALDIATSALVNSTNERNYTMGIDYYGNVAILSIMRG